MCSSQTVEARASLCVSTSENCVNKVAAAAAATKNGKKGSKELVCTYRYTELAIGYMYMYVSEPKIFSYLL